MAHTPVSHTESISLQLERRCSFKTQWRLPSY